MTIEDLIQRFPKVLKNGNGWIARCPAHEDRKPSLSISDGDNGAVLLCCHAGCSIEAITAALGITTADLFPPRTDGNGRVPSRKPAKKTKPPTVYPTSREAVAALEATHGPRSAWWTYADGHGEPVGLVVRWNRAGGKDIRPVSRRGDGWAIGAMPEPRPPYRLPDILAADISIRAYVVEGEKCADALHALRVLSTTSAGGSQAAAKTDWSPLAGREVIVLPDHDTPGERYACDVTAVIAKLKPPATVKVVELFGLGDGGDVVDYIDRRRGEGADDDTIRGEIEALADAADVVKLSPPEPAGGGNNLRSSPVVVRLADVQPEPVKWLWPGRIALGKVTLIAGDPGLGKSFLTLDVAARVSTGAGWPDATGERCSVGGVVLLTAEDDLGDTVRPRLDAAGADVSRVNALQAVRVTDAESGDARSIPFSLVVDLPALEAAIHATPDCRLVVVDPISAYMGKADSHVNTEVRAVLAPLAELAARCGVAVVAVTHLRKGEGAAIYRAMGSLAFVAAARAVWAVTRDKDDPSGRRRLVLPVKNNIAPDTDGLAYTLEPAGNTACVAWSADAVTVSADEALAIPHRRPGPPADERDGAAEWLRSALADGPRPAKDVTEEATHGEGISGRTLERARKELRVVAYRLVVPGPWYWRLPDGEQDRHTLPVQKELGDLGGLDYSVQKEGFSGDETGQKTNTAKLQVCGGLAPDGEPQEVAEWTA